MYRSSGQLYLSRYITGLIGAPHHPPGPVDFCSGDYVRVMLDAEAAVLDNQEDLLSVSCLKTSFIGSMYHAHMQPPKKDGCVSSTPMSIVFTHMQSCGRSCFSSRV